MSVVPLVFIFYALKTTRAIEGVIWSKKDENFVPLFSIASFSSVQNDYLKSLRELEFHNFQNEVLTIAYFQEANIMTFNGTSVSGVFGELWTILAAYLNFTLNPIQLQDRSFGLEHENGSYDGLLGLIDRNETQIIARSGVFVSNLHLLEYTLPLWVVRYHLYLKPEWKYDEAWMFHLCTVEVWYSFFLLLLIMSIAGYLCEKYSVNSPREEHHYNLQDHLLYMYALATCRGYVPVKLYKRSKLIYICTSIFSWVTLSAFSSNAIFLMMNKNYVLPFTDLKSLIQRSRYDLIAFKGSMVHTKFEDLISGYFRYPTDPLRISYVTGTPNFYGKICYSQRRKIAGFDAEDRYKAVGKKFCTLVPTRTSYFETWISSAVRRGYPYKRSFDIGILKLYEAGIVDGLKDRWLDWKLEDSHEIPFQSIDIQQVYLIFAIVHIGCVVSFFILIIECLTYFVNKSVRNKLAMHKERKLKKMNTK